MNVCREHFDDRLEALHGLGSYNGMGLVLSGCGSMNGCRDVATALL